MVVAFYTDGYAEDAALLEASLERAGMSYYMSHLLDEGDWDENTAQKPIFISAMRELLDGPILYVDADAFVHENCEAYFDELGERGVDFGAHWFRGPAFGHDRSEVREEGWWMLSGTLLFGDTDAARRLLDAWIERNEEKRAAGDRTGGGQKNLQEIVPEMDSETKIERLPGRYCYVFDKPWAYPEDEPRVIEHTIASRENRGESAGKVNAARRERVAELREIVV